MLVEFTIIGWPILFIKKGNIIVRLHCSYKSGIRKKIISEVQYTFDENKNKWTLHNENSTTMSIKMKLVDEHSSREDLLYKSNTMRRVTCNYGVKYKKPVISL